MKFVQFTDVYSHALLPLVSNQNRCTRYCDACMLRNHVRGSPCCVAHLRCGYGCRAIRWGRLRWPILGSADTSCLYVQMRRGRCRSAWSWCPSHWLVINTLLRRLILRLSCRVCRPPSGYVLPSTIQSVQDPIHPVKGPRGYSKVLSTEYASRGPYPL